MTTTDLCAGTGYVTRDGYELRCAGCDDCTNDDMDVCDDCERSYGPHAPCRCGDEETPR